VINAQDNKFAIFQIFGKLIFNCETF